MNTPKQQPPIGTHRPDVERLMERASAELPEWTVEEGELVEYLQSQFDEILQLLISKRRDYGTVNINSTGTYGVAVRLQDKISRLLQLTQPAAAAPNHETTNDTWMDIIGYGLIGLTLEQEGEW